MSQTSVNRSAGTLQSIALNPLIELVRQTTKWAEDRTTLEERLGDFRFLILEFSRSDGVFFLRADLVRPSEGDDA